MRLQKIDRALTNRASCAHCRRKIVQGTLRAQVGTAYVHVACAASFAGGELDIELASKPDRAEAAALLLAVKVLDTSPRGRALEAGALGEKIADAEIGVLADWLEEHG